MIVTYSCEECHEYFDGHWHRGKDQSTCTSCGHVNKSPVNIDSDEDFKGE